MKINCRSKEVKLFRLKQIFKIKIYKIKVNNKKKNNFNKIVGKH